MRVKYNCCPSQCFDFENSVFLAGGISNCPDWQNELSKTLRIGSQTSKFRNEFKIIRLINPRRSNFDITNQSLSTEQIIWEYHHLCNSEAVSFWFPKETLCPITLFELGSIAEANKPIFVGVHPEYQRKHDVLVQLGLRRPDVIVVYDLNDLANQILEYFSRK